MIVCLAQSPAAHIYIATRKVVEKMFEIVVLYKQRHKMISEPTAQTHDQQGEKEDPMVINTMRYVTVLPEIL